MNVWANKKSNSFPQQIKNRIEKVKNSKGQERY